MFQVLSMLRASSLTWLKSLAVLLLLPCAIFLNGCKGVGVGPASQPNVVSFAASSSTVTPGTAVTLSWQTVNATGVTIDNGVGAQAANGSVSVKPAVTTTYTLIAQGSGGEASSPATAKVTVSKNAPSVQLTATPNPVRAGASLTIAWTTTNAVSISFNPSIPPVEDTGFVLPAGSDTFLAPQNGTSSQTINYVATVTGSDGTTSTEIGRAHV